MASCTVGAVGFRDHLCVVAAWLGGVLSALLGGWNDVLVCWIVLEVLDYVSGIYRALKRGEGFGKDRAIEGLVKRLVYAFIIVAAVKVDSALAYVVDNAEIPGVQYRLRALYYLTMIWLIAAAFASFCANVGACGVRVPHMISGFLDHWFREFGKDEKKRGGHRK